MKKILALSLIVTALFLAGCGIVSPAEAQQDGFARIDVEILEKMMNERRESFLLVNTHIPFEGNLPTTDFSLAYNETAQNLHLFPAEKDGEIVLYCMSDRMAGISAEQLVEAGYTNVSILSGGMLAWQNAGLSLEMEP